MPHLSFIYREASQSYKIIVKVPEANSLVRVSITIEEIDINGKLLKRSDDSTIAPSLNTFINLLPSSRLIWVTSTKKRIIEPSFSNTFEENLALLQAVKDFILTYRNRFDSVFFGYEVDGFNDLSIFINEMLSQNKAKEAAENRDQPSFQVEQATLDLQQCFKNYVTGIKAKLKKEKLAKISADLDIFEGHVNNILSSNNKAVVIKEKVIHAIASIQNTLLAKEFTNLFHEIAISEADKHYFNSIKRAWRNIKLSSPADVCYAMLKNYLDHEGLQDNFLQTTAGLRSWLKLSNTWNNDAKLIELVDAFNKSKKHNADVKKIRISVLAKDSPVVLSYLLSSKELRERYTGEELLNILNDHIQKQLWTQEDVIRMLGLIADSPKLLKDFLEAQKKYSIIFDLENLKEKSKENNASDELKKLITRLEAIKDLDYKIDCSSKHVSIHAGDTALHLVLKNRNLSHKQKLAVIQDLIEEKNLNPFQKNVAGKRVLDLIRGTQLLAATKEDCALIAALLKKSIDAPLLEKTEINHATIQEYRKKVYPRCHEITFKEYIDLVEMIATGNHYAAHVLMVVHISTINDENNTKELIENIFNPILNLLVIHYNDSFACLLRDVCIFKKTTNQTLKFAEEVYLEYSELREYVTQILRDITKSPSGKNLSLRKDAQTLLKELPGRVSNKSSKIETSKSKVEQSVPIIETKSAVVENKTDPSLMPALNALQAGRDDYGNVYLMTDKQSETTNPVTQQEPKVTKNAEELSEILPYVPSEEPKYETPVEMKEKPSPVEVKVSAVEKNEVTITQEAQTEKTEISVSELFNTLIDANDIYIAETLYQLPIDQMMKLAEEVISQSEKYNADNSVSSEQLNKMQNLLSATSNSILAKRLPTEPLEPEQVKVGSFTYGTLFPPNQNRFSAADLEETLKIFDQSLEVNASLTRFQS